MITRTCFFTYLRFSLLIKETVTWFGSGRPKNENIKKYKKFMSLRSLYPKIRFLGQKVWLWLPYRQTDRPTDRHIRKWIQRTCFQVFSNFSFNLSSKIGSILQTQNYLGLNTVTRNCFQVYCLHSDRGKKKQNTSFSIWFSYIEQPNNCNSLTISLYQILLWYQKHS